MSTNNTSNTMNIIPGIEYDARPEDQLVDDFCTLKNRNKRTIMSEWTHERVSKQRAYNFIYGMGLWDDFNEYIRIVQTK